MRSDVLLVARPGRGPHIECGGGLAARRTHADTVHLLSAAATPLGGDVIAVRIIVEAGARLRVRTVAATIVLPGAGSTVSHSSWDLGWPVSWTSTRSRPSSPAALVTTPPPGCGWARRRRHGSASVQIGRTGEDQGFWTSALHADIDSRPLLRHRVELGAGSIADDALGTPLACVSELRYPDTTFDSEGTVLELAGGGSLSTWQGRRLGG